jgi:hypothetical protein
VYKRLENACKKLNLAIVIRTFLDSNESHEEDKRSFERISCKVTEILELLRANKVSNAAPEQSLKAVMIPNTQITNRQPYKGNRVFKAVYNTAGEGNREKSIPVTIEVKKLLRGDEEKRKLAAEVEYLQKLAESSNIINLIGVVRMEMNYALVFETCELGDLQCFYKDGKLHYDWDKKSNIALGIAQGKGDVVGGDRRGGFEGQHWWLFCVVVFHC